MIADRALRRLRSRDDSLRRHARPYLRPRVVTLQAWGAAAVIVAGSLLVGHALDLLGLRSRTSAPAVGLAMLIVLSSIAIKLPGTAATSAAILLVTFLASVALLTARRGSLRLPAAAMSVIGVAGLGAAIPFISVGRVGLLGVSLDNDMAQHLQYAESLRSAVTRKLYGLPLGYPLGPHSLVATVASGLGVRLDMAFTGLLIATVIVTALTGASALLGQSAARRVIVGSFSGLFYLVVAYYAEAAFKEQLMGLLLMAFVLHLEELRRGPLLKASALIRGLVPVALLWAGSVYVYGYVALAWMVLTAAIWMVAEVVVAPRRLRRWRVQLRNLILPAAAATVLFLILLAPIAGRILNLVNTFGVSPSGAGAISSSMKGNLLYALSPFEALGIWPSDDYRLLPTNQLHAGILVGLALGVFAFGLVWALARRELVLPAAAVACALIWWHSSHGQSIYVTAKALVISGPVVAVTGLRALLGAPRTPLQIAPALSRLALAALFIFFAARSSYEVLANEPVWPSESTNELLALDDVTRGHTVLFLGATDFTDWLFHDSIMTALAPDSGSLGMATPRAAKPSVYGAALDFDSADATALNRFRYVITTNTPFASQPPQAFRLVRALPMYELWTRVGNVAPRQTLEAPGLPGVILDCATASGRALSRRRGIAAVMAEPVTASGGGIFPSASIRVAVTLPAGRWELSLQYTSADSLKVSAGGGHWTMPAYEDRPGPVFKVGAVMSGGGAMLTDIYLVRPSSLTGISQTANVSLLAFTRIPDRRTLLPLARSCGRYVDWFRTESSASR